MKAPIAPLVIALLIAGCASNSSSPATANNAGQGPKTKLVYIPKNTGNPYFTQVIAGFKEAAPQDNIDFDTQAPAKADPTYQLPIIKDQVQRGVDVIVLSAN